MYPSPNAPAPAATAVPQQGQYAPAPTQQMPVAPQPQHPGYAPPPQGPGIPPSQPQQPQYQPIQPQAPVSTYGTFPSVAPGPNQPAGPQVVPPQQPQQQPVQPQPQQGMYDQVYQSIATQTGLPIEQVRANFADNPDRFGTIMAAALKNLRTPVQPGQQQPAPAQSQGQSAPIEVPQIAFNYMKKNEQGIWVTDHPQVQQYADAQNRKEWQERETAQRFLADPRSIVQDPQVSKLIKEQIDQAVQAAKAETQLTMVREQYREKFGSQLYQMDANGQPQMGFEGEYITTPLGASFNKHAKDLFNQGLAEGPKLYETAMALAKAEHPQQTPQPQQFNPLGNMMPAQIPQGQQHIQQPPQQQFAQPGTALHSIIRRNNVAAQFTPGMGAPPRQAQPLRNLSVPDALRSHFQALGMSDNLPMEAYWSAMTGSK